MKADGVNVIVDVQEEGIEVRLLRTLANLASAEMNYSVCAYRRGSLHLVSGTWLPRCPRLVVSHRWWRRLLLSFARTERPLLAPGLH